MPLTPAEKQQRYRERQKALGNAEEPLGNAEGPDLVTQEAQIVTEKSVTVTKTVTERPQTLRGLIAAARAQTIVLSEREEEQIRRHYGYASSEKRTLLQRDEAAARMLTRAVEVEKVELDGTVTVTRYSPSGEPIEEQAGPGGLSLTAFPTQTPGDLRPSPEALAKLQG